MTERALVPSTDGHLTSSQILSGLHTVKGVLAPELSADELKLFAMVAARSGLDPFAKQIYAVKRKGRVTFQTGIDGYRSIAARTGLYDGQDEPEFGPVCECGDGRPVGHPEACTVRVYRKGVGRAIAATAYWHEYKPEAGESGRQDAMWVRMPRVMLSKVAEALALRKAFPYDPERREGIGADLYTADEMSQAERPEPPARPATARERVAERAARLEPEPELSDAQRIVATLATDNVIIEVEPDEPEPAGGLTMDEFHRLAKGREISRQQYAGALSAIGIPNVAPSAVAGTIADTLDDGQRLALAKYLGLVSA